MEIEKIADSTEVLQHLSAAMRGNISDEIIVMERNDSGESEARILEKRIPERDRLRAATLLARRYGLTQRQKDTKALPRIVDDIVPNKNCN